MKTKTKVLLMGLCAGIIITMEASAATLIVDGGKLIGASGVQVGSSFYDVEFIDGSCEDLFNGCDSLDDFLFNETEAIAAAEALDDVFIGVYDTNPELTRGVTNQTLGQIIIVYGFSEYGYISCMGFNNYAEGSDDVYFGAVSPGWDTGGASDLSQNYTYARWTQAFPGLDTDSDGVPDYLDDCPNVFGEAAYDGCPTPLSDQDGDGIPNDVDECPLEFGSKAHNGCPSHRPPRQAKLDLRLIKVNWNAWPDPIVGTIRWHFFPHALVENLGPETARKFDVLFTLDQGTRKSVKVKSLAPGESLWLTPIRDLAGRGIQLQPGEYTLRVVVDKHNKIPEFNESNNVYQMPVVLRSD